MTDHIRCTLAWLRALFVRGTGKRPAATAATYPPPPAPRPPRTRPRLVPEHRHHHDAPPTVDGALVRPYLVAYEQQERRTALALALDGIDVGPWIIHGVRIGAAA